MTPGAYFDTTGYELLASARMVNAPSGEVVALLEASHVLVAVRDTGGEAAELLDTFPFRSDWRIAYRDALAFMTSAALNR